MKQFKLLIAILVTLTTHTLLAKNDCIFIEANNQDYYLFSGTLVEQSNVSLYGASIKLLNTTTSEVEYHQGNIDGSNFSLKLLKGHQYSILISKPGYFSKRINANVGTKGCVLCFESMGNVQPGLVENPSATKKLGTLSAHILLRKIEIDTPVKIDNLYFDVDSYILDAEAKEELNKFYDILVENPGIIVEIAVHTDQRGSSSSNTILSQKRAKAITNYLESKNISSNRMTARGYGETKLINNCPPGELCGEELHQVNRRVEFIVTENTFAGKGIEEERLGFAMKSPDTLIAGTRDYQFGAFGEDLKTGEIVEELSVANNSTSREKPINKDFALKSAEYYKVTSDTKPKMSTDYASRKTNMINAGNNEYRNVEEAPKVPTSIKEFKNQRVKSIPEGYTGWKVEIKYVKGELSDSNILFKEFGGIYCDKIEEEYYSYMLGDFYSEDGAEAFLENIISHKIGDAEVVRYKKGKRIK